jgi:hypothetical protein
MEYNEATEARPHYRKFPMTKSTPNSTQTWGISVDDGAREHILCIGLYDWSVDWLLEQIQGKPFAPGTRP